MAGQVVPGLHGTQADIDELRRSGTALVALALMAASAPAWVFAIPGTGFRPERFLVFFLLFLEGAAAYGLRERSPTVARGILLLGPVLSLALAVIWLNHPLVPAFAVLVVIANLAVSPLLGLSAAILSSLVLYGLLPHDVTLFAALALIWLAGGLQWISSRGLYTAMAWAWSSRQRASELLEELRARRAELRRTVDALTEATRRLQRTGYELTIARLRAEEARRLKEQFAANISHELRTPLNLIAGFAEVMYFSPVVYGEMAWPPTLRRDVHQVYQSSRQLLDLVNDVIDLARTDAAQMPVHREPSDLGAIVEEAMGIMDSLVRGRGLELRAELPPELPRLSLDRARIRQVLLNLLNNAIRFTEKGAVTVSAQVQAHELAVHVADTGTGIAAEELPRIFDEFYQIDMSLRRRQAGAGLGLAICKRFVELHGGRIWAESTPGAGSTFHFTLPLSQQASALPLVMGQAAPAPPSSDAPCVLIVDGDPEAGAVVSRYLKGYRVLQVPELGQAQALVDEQSPRAVVLSVAPGHDLERCLREGLQAVPAQVPVVVCSLPSHSWLAEEAGVRGFLGKPVSREQILQALAGVEGARDVLIVDDDRGFAQLVTRLLQSTGSDYRISWAADGQEALERIAEQRPHAILLDLVMPGMGGLELLDRLSAEDGTRSIPVFLVTAASYGEDVMAQREGVIALGRRRGYGVSEVIRHLQAILGAMEPVLPASSAGEPAEAAAD